MDKYQKQTYLKQLKKSLEIEIFVAIFCIFQQIKTRKKIDF